MKINKKQLTEMVGFSDDDSTEVIVSKDELQPVLDKLGKKATINVVDEDGGGAVKEAPKKLKYLSNIVDENKKVVEPFNKDGKKYQIVRCIDEDTKERVVGVYSLDEVSDTGQNKIYSITEFETIMGGKVGNKDLESDSFNLSEYKHFLLNKTNKKIRKFKTDEDLAKAQMTEDETYMKYGDFKKYVNEKIFGKKKRVFKNIKESSGDVVHTKKEIFDSVKFLLEGDWKAGLDRYLTSGPPDDGFDDWCEAVMQEIPTEVFDVYEEWLTADSGECNSLLNKLFNQNKTVEEAALVIMERLNNLNV